MGISVSIFSIVPLSTYTFSRWSMVAHHTCTFTTIYHNSELPVICSFGILSRSFELTTVRLILMSFPEWALSIRTNWPTNNPTQGSTNGMVVCTRHSVVPSFWTRVLLPTLLLGSVKVSRDKDTCGVRSNRCQTFFSSDLIFSVALRPVLNVCIENEYESVFCRLSDLLFIQSSTPFF